MSSKNGETLLLTKGDANGSHDRDLYAPGKMERHNNLFVTDCVLSIGQMWLKREDVVGRIRGVVRKVGFITIKLNDMPSLKFDTKKDGKSCVLCLCVCD